MVGVGRGAQAGVLFKNAGALERLEKVMTLVVDKSSTLTEGKPKLIDVLPVAGFKYSNYRAVFFIPRRNPVRCAWLPAIERASKRFTTSRPWKTP
jgi:hypothetical protein